MLHLVLIDLCHIPVNEGIKSRLRWTTHSDLYEIVHPSLDLTFMFAHWSGMQERSVPKDAFSIGLIITIIVIHIKYCPGGMKKK